MKRFYQDVVVARHADLFQVTLDNRPIKTALGNPQLVPTQALADALAKEWGEQGEKIDPALFRFRDLADFAVDMVAPDRAGSIIKLLSYCETDALCYRAQPDEPFFERQEQVWEPLMTAFEARENVRLKRICGIIHQPQPKDTLGALTKRLEQVDDYAMTALLTMTSLAASLTIGMSAAEGDADIDALWAAANLEEDWQIEQWGDDAEALAVRARRTSDFFNASNFAMLLG